MKICGKCKLEKDEICFGRSRQSPGGLRWACKDCRKLETKSEATKEKQRLRSAKWYASGKHRDAYYFRKFGITGERYNEMFAEQNGVCAICFGRDARRLHVDHSHETNVVRGLLCGRCNRAIGFLKDNAQIALSAANYLLSRTEREVTYREA